MTKSCHSSCRRVHLLLEKNENLSTTLKKDAVMKLNVKVACVACTERLHINNARGERPYCKLYFQVRLFYFKKLEKRFYGVKSG